MARRALSRSIAGSAARDVVVEREFDRAVWGARSMRVRFRGLFDRYRSIREGDVVVEREFDRAVWGCAIDARALSRTI
jgi:hypothetical protein